MVIVVKIVLNNHVSIVNCWKHRGDDGDDGDRVEDCPKVKSCVNYWKLLVSTGL